MYEHEIDIVRLLQHFRFMRHFSREMLEQMPARDRLKFNSHIKQSMFRKIKAASKSDVGAESSDSHDSFLKSVVSSPDKIPASGATGNARVDID